MQMKSKKKCLYFFALSLILTILPKLGDNDVTVGGQILNYLKNDFIFGFSAHKLVYMHIFVFLPYIV